SIYFSLALLQNHPRFGADPVLDKQYDRLLRLIRFTKPYRGEFFRRGKYLKTPVTFYNEREWRYIPDVTEPSNRKLLQYAKPWLDKTTYLDYRKLIDATTGQRQIDLLNQELQNAFPLNFDVGTIRYLILKKDTEIPGLLRSLKGTFEPDKIAILASKIITREQIFEDF
ncbi:MAG: hypothetical protein JNK89_05445, partial [Saprospiraceae bacterium]|nr:hypothetical protein [Saprospiraceae bacterium]